MSSAAVVGSPHCFLLIPPALLPPPLPLPHAVLSGMEVVTRIESLGSSSGRPGGRVVIKDSGELPLLREHSRPVSPEEEEDADDDSV